MFDAVGVPKKVFLNYSFWGEKMDRKVLRVVCIRDFGSSLVDSAVSKLVSRLSINVKLSCGGTGVAEIVPAGLADLATA